MHATEFQKIYLGNRAYKTKTDIFNLATKSKDTEKKICANMDLNIKTSTMIMIHTELAILYL